MTNRQKLGELEKELGRWRKHCEDLAKGNAKLVAEREKVRLCSASLDAVMIQTALAYGEDAVDPDSGKVIGKRLTLPKIDIKALMTQYELHARKDAETGAYIIGVGLRDDPEDHRSETEGAR